MPRSSFGHVRQRESGRWQARYQDAQGRQHSQTFRTKPEASKWLRDQWKDRDDGRWVDPRDGKVTFREFSDRWRETIVDLRPSTLARDLGYLDRYLLPSFGDRSLAAIDYLAVRAWVADMGSAYAPATTVKAAQIFGKIMRAAVVAKLVASSPLDGVNLPRVDREEMRFLTPDEIWRLVDVIGDRWQGVVLLGAFGGLRAGEIFGLKIGSVDPLRRQVHVVEIATEVEGRTLVGPPKTRTGRRTVPLPKFVFDTLDMGGAPVTLLFPNGRGRHVGLASWRSRIWRPAVAAAGLAPLRIHDLRHTAVALWIAAGAQPFEIARRAGHSSTSVVQDRYGHLLPGHEDRLTDALEVFGPTGRDDAGVVLPLSAGLRSRTV